MRASRPLSLSDIHVLGKAATNPHALHVERSSEEICRDWGIMLPGFSGFVTMSSYLFPRASRDRFEAIVLMHNFLFFIDDSFDRHDERNRSREREFLERNEELAAVFGGDGDLARKSGLNGVMWRLRELMLSLSNDEWLTRFAQTIRRHLVGSVYCDVQALDVQSYVGLRVVDSGMAVAIDFIEFANGRYLTKEMLNDVDIKKMVECCALFGALTNDLFSYHKEVELHGSSFNLISMLMKERGVDFAEAVSEAVEMLNGLSSTFLVLAERYSPDGVADPAVIGFVQGLTEAFAASWHWQISTPRYRSPDSPFPELRG